MQKTLPTIDVANQPLVQHIKDSLELQKGARGFLEQGVLIVKNVFTPEYIQRAHADFVEEYREYFEDKTFEDALNVGHKRTMISLLLKGEFNTPDFYANAKVLPLLRFLLGNDLILNSLGAVVSLPGSKDQHVHRDHVNIYGTECGSHTGLNWVHKAPPYGITMGVPLVDITKETGNTRFWPGSHHNLMLANKVNPADGVDFTSQMGTCILFDYRIIHGGIANNSGAIRPLLYNVYARSWFRDTRNYRKQDPLVVTPEQIAGVPKQFRHMFDWTLDAATRNRLTPPA